MNKRYDTDSNMSNKANNSQEKNILYRKNKRKKVNKEYEYNNIKKKNEILTKKFSTQININNDYINTYLNSPYLNSPNNTYDDKK